MSAVPTHEDFRIPDGRVRFRHFLYHKFGRSQNATDTARDICFVGSNDAIAKNTTQKLLPCLKTVNALINLEDAPRSGQFLGLGKDYLKALLPSNPPKNSHAAYK